MLLVLDDTTAFPIAFLGAMRIGAVPVPVSHLDKDDNFRHFVDDSYARGGRHRRRLLPRLAAALGDPAMRYLVRGRRRRRRDRVRRGAWPPSRTSSTPPPTHRDDMAFWLYSSGSTGKPKGVVHLQHDIEVTCETLRAPACSGCAPTTSRSPRRSCFTPTGWATALSFPLWFGATSVLMSRPAAAASRSSRRLRAHRPTVFFSVPGAVRRARPRPGRRRRARLGAVLRLGRRGAAAARRRPLARALRPRHRRRHRLDRDAAHLLLQPPGRDRAGHDRAGRCRATSCGSSTTTAACSRARRSGRLQVRGDSCAAYYWHQHEKTKRSMRGDWFATGDRYERAEDGTYAYVGRIDDMLKVGGLWVSPVDMEHALIEHPAGARRRCRGITSTTPAGSPRTSSARRRPGDDALADELRAWCKERMRRYEYPHVVRVRRRAAAHAHRQGAAVPAPGARRATPGGARMRAAVIGAGPAGFYAADQLLGSRLRGRPVRRPPDAVRAGALGRRPRPPEDQVGHARLREDRGEAGLPLLRRRGAGRGHLARRAARALPRGRLRVRHARTTTGSGSRARTARAPRRHRLRGWYNGHPDAGDQEFDLSCAARGRDRQRQRGDRRRADAASSTPTSSRRPTPPTTPCEALGEAQVQEVSMLGRRGPAQAAFTNPELRELGEMTGADVHVDPPTRARRPSARPDRADPRPAQRRDPRGYAARGRPGRPRRISLKFLRSPVEILGDGEDGPVTGIRRRSQPARGDDGRARADRREEVIDCGLVLRSIGYRGRPIDDIPFDERRGLIRNEGGRVCDEDGTPLRRRVRRRLDQARAERRDRDEQEGRRRHGGQDRRGPRGRRASTASARRRGRSPSGWPARADAVTWEGWQAIDEHERGLGEPHGRPRVKLVRLADLMAAGAGRVALSLERSLAAWRRICGDDAR